MSYMFPKRPMVGGGGVSCGIKPGSAAFMACALTTWPPARRNQFMKWCVHGHLYVTELSPLPALTLLVFLQGGPGPGGSPGLAGRRGANGQKVCDVVSSHRLTTQDTIWSGSQEADEGCLSDSESNMRVMLWMWTFKVSSFLKFSSSVLFTGHLYIEVQTQLYGVVLQWRSWNIH